jgi:tetratricopeptide (TPR) repeat protein/regulation of enolase protein 1 (concanavalin A-like superfamily)
LKGLGQIYLGVGRAAEAEDHFSRAITVGREVGLAPRELARMFFWLADVLFWESRYDEMIRIGHEGLMLLREAPEAVETVLMNQTIAVSYWMKGDKEKYWEFAGRNVPLLQGLSYSEELRPAYSHMIMAYAMDKKLEEAQRWSEALEEQAQQHHDVRAAAAAVCFRAWFILLPSGDLRGAVAEFGKALERYEKIGDTKHQGMAPMARAFLGLGELPQAEECASRALHAMEATGQANYIAVNCAVIGTVALCRGRWDQAAEAFGRAAQLYGEVGSRRLELAARVSLGRAYLAQGEREAAVKALQEALTLARRVPSGLAAVLSGLEEAYGGAGELETLWARSRAERPEFGGEPPFLCEDFAASLSPEWVWHDPFGDCSMTMRSPGRLEIEAANGRDLWHINRSAPRLLRAASGDFAVQTVCLPVLEEKPAIGGLLLWKDEENYLRLDRGTRGPYEISFQGCLANSDGVIGRGRLPSERIFLRLERRGGQVRALCSADGATWYTAGSAALPVEDPVEVGLHAIGSIDRTLYPGAYPEGTAIRFEAFELR